MADQVCIQGSRVGDHCSGISSISPFAAAEMLSVFGVIKLAAFLSWANWFSWQKHIPEPT